MMPQALLQPHGLGRGGQGRQPRAFQPRPLPGAAPQATLQDNWGARLARPGRSLPLCRMACRAGNRAREQLESLLPEEPTKVFAFGLDGVVCDASEETTCVAFRVAKALWPEDVVGEEAMYLRKVREVWPALSDPRDAVLLVRLLSEEGAIGGRSLASDRAGPIAQPSGARSTHGTRPLQAGEIIENWSDLREVCMLRWGVRSMDDVSALFRSAREEWAAQDRGGWLSTIRPYTPIVAAMRECPDCVYALGGGEWDSPLVEAVLEHCGVPRDSCRVVGAPEPDAAVSEVLEGAGEGVAVHVVQGRLSDLESAAESVAGSVRRPEELGALRLHLSDWGMCTPQMKARAVLSPAVGVITDMDLVELMGQGDCAEAMDMVSWRRED